MRILALVLVIVVGVAAPAEGAWRRPVPGEMARPFAYGSNPFAAGWHRGVDLSARRGEPVRAACTGRVATARPGLVTLRCGPWRVTHLPLGSVTVRRGEAVAAGRLIGTVGSGAGSPAAPGSGTHAGLHLGVRRAGEPFGYVDPMRFLGAASPPSAPVAPTPPIPRAGPLPAAAPRARPEPAPHAGPAPYAGPVSRADPLRAPVRPQVRVFVPSGARVLAPWPAWAGLALLLLGAAGGGVRIGVRRRRERGRAAVPSAP